MSDYECGVCGTTQQFSCSCWEREAATYEPAVIAGTIRLEESRDQHYGVGRGPGGVRV